MRTTIDLDPDVDRKLRALAHRRGVSLKTVINETLRAATHPKKGESEPYVMPTRSLGVRPGINLDKAGQLAAEMEDEEILRKLELRK